MSEGSGWPGQPGCQALTGASVSVPRGEVLQSNSKVNKNWRALLCKLSSSASWRKPRALPYPIEGSPNQRNFLCRLGSAWDMRKHGNSHIVSGCLSASPGHLSWILLETDWKQDAVPCWWNEEAAAELAEITPPGPQDTYNSLTPDTVQGTPWGILSVSERILSATLEKQAEKMEGGGEKRYSIFLQGCRKPVTARRKVLPTVSFSYHPNQFADLDQSSRVRMGTVQHKPLNKLFEGVPVQWATAVWAWMFPLGQCTLCPSVSWEQAFRTASRTYALGSFQGAALCGGSTPTANSRLSLYKSPISLAWHTKSNEQIHYLNQACTKAQTLHVSHLLFLTLIHPLRCQWHVNAKSFKAVTDTSHPLFSPPTSEWVYAACQKKKRGKWNKANELMSFYR